MLFVWDLSTSPTSLPADCAKRLNNKSQKNVSFHFVIIFYFDEWRNAPNTAKTRYPTSEKQFCQWKSRFMKKCLVVKKAGSRKNMKIFTRWSKYGHWGLRIGSNGHKKYKELIQFLASPGSEIAMFNGLRKILRSSKKHMAVSILYPS